MKAPAADGRAWPLEQAAAGADASRARRSAGARASSAGSGERPAAGQPLSAGRPVRADRLAHPAGDLPLSAGQRFSALLEPPARSMAAPGQADTAEAGSSRPTDRADSPMPQRPHGEQAVWPEPVAPAWRGAEVAPPGSGPRTLQAPAAAKATMAEDDFAGLLDEVADLVCMQRSGRARHWSVSVWLREAVLRDTQLALSGEPGRIAIRFSSTDADSLRRLRAGQDELQARLQARIAVPHLQLAIESAHATTPPACAATGEHD